MSLKSGRVGVKTGQVDKQGRIPQSGGGDSVFSVDESGNIVYINGEITEYLNPPLVVGTEYRTTERYDAKPVYAKLISVGNLSTDMSYSHSISDIKDIVVCRGNIRGYGPSWGSIFTGGYIETGSYITASATRQSIFVHTNYTSASSPVYGQPVYVLLKYTKTTD